MDQEKSRKRTRISLWELNELSLFLVLEMNFSPEKRMELLTESLGECSETFTNDKEGWNLFMVQRACKKRNAVSSEMETLLEQMHNLHVFEVRMRSVKELRNLVFDDGIEPCDTAGMLWALLTDPDEDKQELGNYFAHLCMQQRFDPFKLFDSGVKGCCSKISSDLLEQNRRKQQTIDRLLDYVNRLREAENSMMG